MTKFNLAVEDLLGPDGVIESRIARSQLPESVISTVSRLRQAIEEEYGSLTAAAVGIDPTLEKTVQGARSNAVRGVEEIEKKLVTHLKKRSETELGQVRRARNAGQAGRQAAGTGVHGGAIPGAIRPRAPRRRAGEASAAGTPAPLKGPGPAPRFETCPSSRLLLLVALMIPMLGIMLDSPFGRALARQARGPGSAPLASWPSWPSGSSCWREK